MKIFWLSVLRRFLVLLLLSFAVLWFSKETILAGAGTTAALVIASLGIVLSTGVIIGVTTLGLHWMLKRIAKDQGVRLEDVVFALYDLKWNFNRVVYDKNFPRDLLAAIADHEEIKRIQKQIEDEEVEHWEDL